MACKTIALPTNVNRLRIYSKMPVGTIIAAGIRFEDVALKDLKLYMMLFDLSVIENRKFAIFQSSRWNKNVYFGHGNQN